MKVIGITGGIGMGKSTAGDLLLKRGFPVVDTDTIARNLVEPGRPALAEIRNLFGDAVFDPKGELRRDQLANVVFANPAARQKLERILHPRIRIAWESEIERWRKENPKFAFVLIPLLFETSAAPSFDATICVACSPKSQFERLKARGWSEDQIALRKAAQWPLERKVGAADFVVWTDTTLEVHDAQLEQALKTI